MYKLIWITTMMICMDNLSAQEVNSRTGYWLNDLRVEAEFMGARKSGASAFDSGIYYGYVVGAADITKGMIWCANEQLTNGRIIAIVSDYIKANPDILTSAAKVIVGNALSEALPCNLPKK